MKALILITLLLPGCLFVDFSTSTCEGTGTCSNSEIYGEFIGYGKECYELAAPIECIEENCEDQFVECRHFIELSLENSGSQTAAISEPTQLDLYSPDGEMLYTLELDGLRYSTTDDHSISAGSPTFKRILELAPDESVGLSLSFYMAPDEQVAAKASIAFEVRDQDDLIITTNTIKFGNPPIEHILDKP